jgi:hypothetical protein
LFQLQEMANATEFDQQVSVSSYFVIALRLHHTNEYTMLSQLTTLSGSLAAHSVVEGQVGLLRERDQVLLHFSLLYHVRV